MRKIIIVSLTFCFVHPLIADSRDKAIRLFQRLAGVPPTEAQVNSMASLLDQGQLLQAAHLATDKVGAPSFFNVTVKQFASSLTNRAEVPLVPFNDMMASFIGVARDERDARELLYETFSYAADQSKLPANFNARTPSANTNAHYAELETKNINLADVLVRSATQVSVPVGTPDSDIAGVLTSRAWGEAHLVAGTNRRAAEFAFREFLCKPLSDMADGSINDYHVRRDVDRAPGGNGMTYQSSCRTCHAGLDAIAGAFAFFNFAGGRINHTPGQVQQKVNQNSQVYPDGFVTVDNSWSNLFTRHQNQALGWKGSLNGVGVKDFGRMIANADGFSDCMAQKVFQTVCYRAPKEAEKGYVSQLATGFQQSNYNLRTLFENTAVLPICLGE